MTEKRQKFGVDNFLVQFRKKNVFKKKYKKLNIE